MKRLRARRLDTGLAIRDLLPQRDWRVTFRQKQARPRPETRRLLGTKTERHRCRQPPHARTSPEGAVGAPTNASPPAMLARLPAIMSTLDSLSRAGLPSIHPRSLEPCRKTHRPSSITPCGNSAQKTTTACTQVRCPDRRSISSLRLAAAASACGRTRSKDTSASGSRRRCRCGTPSRSSTMPIRFLLSSRNTPAGPTAMWS